MDTKVNNRSSRHLEKISEDQQKLTEQKHAQRPHVYSEENLVQEDTPELPLAGPTAAAGTHLVMSCPPSPLDGSSIDGVMTCVHHLHYK